MTERRTTTITVEIGDEDAALISELCDQLASPSVDGSEFNTHGRLTPETLLAMLAEDCALAVTRPGSWEGAGLLDVLARHGYG